MSDPSKQAFDLLEAPKKHYGTLRNFVGGKWVEVATDRTIDVDDPASGEVIAQVPCSGKADVDAVIQAAQDGYWAWRTTPPAVRGRHMFRMREALEKYSEDLARLTTQEHGKAIAEARGETLRTIEAVETAAAVTSVVGGYQPRRRSGAQHRRDRSCASRSASAPASRRSTSRS